MIFVAATRLTESGTFSYVVQVVGKRPLVTLNAGQAKAELTRLGVAEPQRLLAHVREWGSVEIDDDGKVVEAKDRG